MTIEDWERKALLEQATSGAQGGCDWGMVMRLLDALDTAEDALEEARSMPEVAKEPTTPEPTDASVMRAQLESVRETLFKLVRIIDDVLNPTLRESLLAELALAQMPEKPFKPIEGWKMTKIGTMEQWAYEGVVSVVHDAQGWRWWDGMNWKPATQQEAFEKGAEEVRLYTHPTVAPVRQVEASFQIPPEGWTQTPANTFIAYRLNDVWGVTQFLKGERAGNFGYWDEEAMQWVLAAPQEAFRLGELVVQRELKRAWNGAREQIHILVESKDEEKPFAVEKLDPRWVRSEYRPFVERHWSFEGEWLVLHTVGQDGDKDEWKYWDGEHWKIANNAQEAFENAQRAHGAEKAKLKGAEP